METTLAVPYTHLIWNKVVWDDKVFTILDAFEDKGELVYRLNDTDFYGNPCSLEVEAWDTRDLDDYAVIGSDMLSEVADLIWEDVDIAEEMVYEMGYSIV